MWFKRKKRKEKYIAVYSADVELIIKADNKEEATEIAKTKCGENGNIYLKELKEVY